MNPLSPANRDDQRTFVLRFQSFRNAERAYAFPCDAVGHVDLDALSDQARNTYFYARAVVGREVSSPKVQSCAAF